MTNISAAIITESNTPSYRWRVLVAVPPGGFGAQLRVMQAWLNQCCGPEGWRSAAAGAGGTVNDGVAFYFADPAAARAFLDRFCCGYRAAPPQRL
jgi:hypothetical protein